jgi:hypothetical protein
MHNHAAGDNPVRLEGELTRPNAPTFAEPRAASDAHEPQLATQLDAWEDEGGTPAPR